jgi:hypothetical protein
MLTLLFLIALVTAEPFFVVLNDIHVHAAYHRSVNRLEWFCREAVPALKTAGLKYIVLNGDLVDSGTTLFSITHSQQKEEEWKLLEHAIKPCLDAVPVLPVRGNHDCFNVEHYHHATNGWWLKF